MNILHNYENRLLKVYCNIIFDSNKLIVYLKVSRFEIANNSVNIFSEFMFVNGIFKCIILFKYYFLS